MCLFEIFQNKINIFRKKWKSQKYSTQISLDDKKVITSLIRGSKMNHHFKTISAHFREEWHIAECTKHIEKSGQSEEN